MKNRYKRKAWYLDEDVLLEGYTDKRGFHPDNFACGFGTQGFTKVMIGKEIFFDLDEALRVCGNVEVITKDSYRNMLEELSLDEKISREQNK